MGQLFGIIRDEAGQFPAMLLDLRQRGGIGRQVAVATGNEVAALAGFGVLQARPQLCQVILDRVTVCNRVGGVGLPDYAAVGTAPTITKIVSTIPNPIPILVPTFHFIAIAPVMDRLNLRLLHGR